MFKTLEDYQKDKKSQYPSDNINPSLKKNDEYYRAFCEAMLAEYSSGRMEVPFEFGEKRSFETLRQYAQGKQSPDKIKDRLLGKRRENGKFVTKMNVSWDGLDVMPKMMDLIREKNMGEEYKVTAMATDSDSMNARNLEKAYAKTLLEQSVQRLMARAKMKPQGQLDPKELGMKSEADVDVFFDSGGYTLQREMAAIAVGEKTKLESGFKVIQDMIFDDLTTLSIAGLRNYYDYAGRVVKTRYVDPQKAIIPYSKYLDFRDINRAAELRELTIAEARELNPNITEAQWLYIAKNFCYMNPDYAAIIASNKTGFYGAGASDYGVDPINACRILVLDAQWLSMDQEKSLKTTRKSNGNTIFKEVDPAFELDAKELKRGSELKKRSVVRKYYAQWIVGSQYFLSYGQAADCYYTGPQGNRTPRLDFFFGKTGNTSIVERCVAHIDDINMAVVKRRNAIATLPPAPRMVIQQSLLDNVFLNGILQQPEDLFKTLQERGYLVVNNTDDHGRPLFTNQRPVDYLPTNIVEDINVFSQEIRDGIERIREVSGMNGAADASTPNPYTGLGKMEIAQNTANAALVPTFNAFNYIFNGAFDDVVKKWQVLVRTYPQQVAYSPLSERTITTLQLGEEFCNADFNIRIEVQATKEQRQQILQDLTQMKADFRSSQGASGISQAEYLKLWEVVQGGNLKFAMYLAAQMEAQHKAEFDLKTQQNQEFTHQSQIESAQAAEKARQDTVRLENKGGVILEVVKGVQDRKTEILKAYLASLAPAPTAAGGTSPAAAPGAIDPVAIEQLLTRADAELQAVLSTLSDDPSQESSEGEAAQQEAPMVPQTPQEQQLSA